MTDRAQPGQANPDVVSAHAAEDRASSRDPEPWIEEIANSDYGSAYANVDAQSQDETTTTTVPAPRAPSEWITDAGHAYAPADEVVDGVAPATYQERIDRLKERGATLRKKNKADDQNGLMVLSLLVFAVAAILTWVIDVNAWFWGSAWVLTGAVFSAWSAIPDRVPDADLRSEERRLGLPSPPIGLDPPPPVPPGGPVGVAALMGVTGMIILTVVMLLSGDDAASQSARPSSSVSSDAWEDCMDPWDGNHNGFEDQVRALLNDPRSMDTISTWVSRLLEDGTHRITMDYTARNVLGGVVRTTAVGNLNPTTCMVWVTEFGY